MTDRPDYTRAIITNDLTASYKIADIDDSESTKYFGFTDPDGNWFIMQLTATSARYAKGTTDYPTAWTARAAQAYDYYYATF